MSRIRKGIVTRDWWSFSEFFLPEVFMTPGQGEQQYSPILPNYLPNVYSQDTMDTLAILLNKLIATLNQVDFFLLKRVDYYYREQQIIIRGPNLKTRPSFKQEANKRHPVLLWVGRKAAPGHLSSEWRTKHKTGQSDLFQEAALVCDPYLLCMILSSFLHCEEHCKESHSL